MNEEAERPDTFPVSSYFLWSRLTNVYPDRISKYKAPQIWQIMQSSNGKQHEWNDFWFSERHLLSWEVPESFHSALIFLQMLLILDNEY